MWPRIAAACLSGALVAAAYPPWEWRWLAWCGLVPWFLALRGTTVRRASALGLVYGVAFYATAMPWVPGVVAEYLAITPAGGFAVATGAALLWALTPATAAALATWAGWTRSPGLVAAAAWVVAEWGGGQVATLFPWISLGATQARDPYVAQWAAAGGVLGIAALLAAVNALVADGLARHDGRRLRTAAALIAISYAGGWARWASLAPPAGERTLRVGIVQPAVTPAMRAESESADRLTEQLLVRSRAAAQLGAQLVVWPENALPYSIDEPTTAAARVTAFIRASGVEVVTGAAGLVWRDGVVAETNEAVVLGADGRAGNRYVKQHRTPIGEYVPGGAWGLALLGKSSWRGELAVGAGPAVLSVRGARLGPLLCYEAVFPALARATVLAGADVLVNLTNDAWFAAGAGARQHFALVVLRAVETGRPLVRVANTGVSAVIDARGTVRWEGPVGLDLVHVEDIPLTTTVTPYVTLGEWIAAAGAIVLAMAIVPRRTRDVPESGERLT